MNVWRAFYHVTQNYILLRKVLKETSQMSQVLILHISLLFSSSLQVYFLILFVCPSSYIPPPPFSTSPPPPYTELRRGQAVLDYDGTSPEELSLMIHEVLNIYELDPPEEEFLLGERDTRRGKVPRAYIKIIS